ncbi:MAG: murein hydrolase activator EnvC family protein, partial [Roseicyclus sp.]
QRGRLPWPVVGRVEVPFGKKVDPDSGMVLLSRGLDIRAHLSAPVRAVFPGRVVYAASRAGFGRLAIVDHGGFYTLYAHLESFAVRAGDPVAAQQVLGHVGDSGSTKGAYLYFEIRKGRDPVDPIRWLAP